MNFNKFSKTIFAIISSCCLCSDGVNALKQSILDARQSEETKRTLPDVGELIAYGECGYIYKHLDNDTRLIKKVRNGKEPKFGKLHEFDIAHLMMQKDVPSSLMKVYYASNCKWCDVWYEIEKIRGISIDCFKENIEWDFFCRHWVIGLFEGMKYFQDQVGITELYDVSGKKEEYFAFLGDRGGNNILVRIDGPDKYKPVHIDYSFATYYKVHGERNYYYHPRNELNYIAKILLNILENCVINIPNNEKINELKKYLNDIKEMELPNKNTLNEIIEKVKKITGVS